MPDDPKTDTISLVEEQVSVTKQAVLTGRVRIATQTETIEQRLPAELSSEEIKVVRVPVDRRVDAMPQTTTEGDLTIIPVVEERLVVTRELYLREEVHVRRIRRQESVEIPAETRRQTVRIERLSPDGEALDPIPSNSKDDHDDL
ncbi:YsnF/AvaK domain-containing protein [Paracoccus everestensis]|uniref:YsnF/AvaK domain-containing protein n=1 Tax=Paracoccus everestensis TaxID=2903900 RepID=UPI001F3971F0|nr:YsnF/AvaK domain-containing protein [Paracoccus everestensis]